MAPIPVRRVALWLTLAASGPLVAFPQTWSSVGPPGGWVEALVVDPVTPTALWVGTDGGGLFRSTDSGSTWFSVSSGLDDLAVRAVAVDPSDPRIVYVGTGRTGVFKSTDRGATWHRASNGMAGGSFLPVYALVLDPGLPSTLLAGSEGAAPMYRSTDSGGSWVEAGAGLQAFAVQTLVADPRVPGTYFAGTSAGLWRTVDDATTWTPCDPDDLGVHSIVAVLLPAGQPGTVYAAEANTIFKSTDNAVSFTELPPLPLVPGKAGGVSLPEDRAERPKGFGYKPLVQRGALRECFLCLFLPWKTLQDMVLVVVVTDGGLFVTEDDGAHWNSVTDQLPTREIRGFAETLPQDPHLFVGSRGSGMFVLSGDETWQPTSSGLVAAKVTEIAIADGVLLAGTRGADLQRSTDGGAIWAHANGSVLQDGEVHAVVADAEGMVIVYSATFGGGSRVFRTTDRGSTWSPLETGAPSNLAFALAVDPIDATKIYAGGNDGVRRTTDGGTTWQPANGGIEGRQVRSLAIEPGSPGAIYAGLYGQGVWKSTDRGTTWVEANGDGTSGFLEVGLPHALAADPARPGTVWAGLDSRGVWRTTDGGSTWQQRSEGLLDEATITYASVFSIALDPSDPNLLWLAAGASLFSSTPSPKGVFLSTDGGGHWTAADPALAGVSTLTVAVDPDDPSRVYAGTDGQGAFRLGEAPSTGPGPRRLRGRFGP